MLVRNIPNPRRNRGAFTLMELLIVVAIIVVLAGIGGFLIFPLLNESKENIALAKSKTLANAVQMHVLSGENYPSSVDELLQPPSGKPAKVNAEACQDPWGHPYQIGPADASGVPYIYTQGPDGKVISNFGIGVGGPQ